jgi:hypothetical protein
MRCPLCDGGERGRPVLCGDLDQGDALDLDRRRLLGPVVDQRWERAPDWPGAARIGRFEHDGPGPLLDRLVQVLVELREVRGVLAGTR